MTTECIIQYSKYQGSIKIGTIKYFHKAVNAIAFTIASHCHLWAEQQEEKHVVSQQQSGPVGPPRLEDGRD